MSIIFECKSRFECTRETLFQFHEDPKGFDILVGLDPSIQVIQKPENIQIGAKAIVKVKILPGISRKWISLHTDYKKNEYFEDTQLEGPFRKFIHKHLFVEEGSTCFLIDQIELDFPFLFISKYIIATQLIPQFKKRHKITSETLKVPFEQIYCGWKLEKLDLSGK